MIAFNVAQLMKSLTGTIRRITVDDTDEELQSELSLVSPVHGELRLMRTTRGILVKGDLSFQIGTTCSRCLEDGVQDTTIHLNEEFLPVVDVNTGVPLEDESPDNFKLTENHLLSLDEAIRQYAILESPLRPLCREDCQGLCTRCGANLNQGPCGCGREGEDTASGSLGSVLAERLRQTGFKPEEE